MKRTLTLGLLSMTFTLSAYAGTIDQQRREAFSKAAPLLESELGSYANSEWLCSNYAVSEDERVFSQVIDLNKINHFMSTPSGLCFNSKSASDNGVAFKSHYVLRKSQDGLIIESSIDDSGDTPYSIKSEAIPNAVVTAYSFCYRRESDKKSTFQPPYIGVTPNTGGVITVVPTLQPDGRPIGGHIRIVPRQ